MHRLTLILTMLVAGCVSTAPGGKYSALQVSIPAKAKAHAAALADCVVPECTRAVLTGQALLSALDAGLETKRR